MYWAEVSELPGCFASGKNLDELQEALQEAIQFCLEDSGESQRQFEVAEMTVATGAFQQA